MLLLNFGEWRLTSRTTRPPRKTSSRPALAILDTISAALDALTTSLDDFSSSTTPEIPTFDPAHTLNFFRGANLQATLDTAEQGTDGTRIKVRGFRPVTDAPVLYGSVSFRAPSRPRRCSPARTRSMR
jgi:hypothetical protein